MKHASTHTKCTIRSELTPLNQRLIIIIQILYTCLSLSEKKKKKEKEKKAFNSTVIEEKNKTLSHTTHSHHYNMNAIHLYIITTCNAIQAQIKLI